MNLEIAVSVGAGGPSVGLRYHNTVSRRYLMVFCHGSEWHCYLPLYNIAPMRAVLQLRSQVFGTVVCKLVGVVVHASYAWGRKNRCNVNYGSFF